MPSASHKPNPSNRLQPDIVIIGGGIAGLWTLSHLRNQGYSAVLFEQDALGSGQTINSQGIIHGGLKYALSGRAGPDALALAALSGLWQDCLSGRGPLNLSDTAVVSDHIHMWSSGTPSSRLTTFLGGKALRGQIKTLARDSYPQMFSGSEFRGVLYRLEEQVLDVPSLLNALAQQGGDHIRSIDWQQASLESSDGRVRLRLPGIDLLPRVLLLAAGSGNAELLRSLGANAPAMQRRPLQQVLVHQTGARPLFGHFIGTGLEPRLSITSHLLPNGDTVWYLGGALATQGANDEPQALIKKAQQELALALPGWQNNGAQWHTLKVDRAEVSQTDGSKPDDSFLGTVPGIDNLMVCWPTKLVMAPQLADKVSRRLSGTPRTQFDISCLAHLDRPAIAKPAWETLFS